MYPRAARSQIFLTRARKIASHDALYISAPLVTSLRVGDMKVLARGTNISLLRAMPRAILESFLGLKWVLDQPQSGRIAGWTI